MSPTRLIQAQIDIFSLQAHNDNNKNMISSYSPSAPLHPPFLSLFLNKGTDHKFYGS